VLDEWMQQAIKWLRAQESSFKVKRSPYCKYKFSYNNRILIIERPAALPYREP